MREIKFRVWDKESKRFVESDEFLDYIGLECNNSVYTLYHDDDYVLMQYTGLKDKNGVEIYEGDIITVDHHGKLFEVDMFDYEDNTCQTIRGYGYKEKGKSKYGFEIHYLNNAVTQTYAKVKGNIYENPELLNK